MSSVREKLAASLEQLRVLQQSDRDVFRSEDFERDDRELLLQNGFLQPIIPGWLMTSHPGAAPHDTTPWHASFWEFCARYGAHRFGNQWHLDPAQSLLLHTENTTIPKQVILRAPRGSNNRVALPFENSLFDLKVPEMPKREELCERNGVRLFTPDTALARVPASFFADHPLEARTILSSPHQPAGVLRQLLAGGNTVVAGRLAGAFRHIGRDDAADSIRRTMREAGLQARETNPFLGSEGDTAFPTMVHPPVGRSALSRRLQAMWEMARDPILAALPPPPGRPPDDEAFERYVQHMKDTYVTDAYHSLSIEGYKVSPELVEKVRSGTWNPQAADSDGKDHDALAARGYWEAAQAVQGFVRDVLRGAPAAERFRIDHGQWYSRLFGPFATIGLYDPATLVGYRNHAVFLRNSRHVPPRWELVAEGMDTFCELLENEPEPAVRTIAGHWLFGYIHPYPDGNGRIARFLMNGMLASGGYPWTVIKVQDRDAYVKSLEAACADLDLTPHIRFMDRVVRESLASRPEADAKAKAATQTESHPPEQTPH